VWLSLLFSSIAALHILCFYPYNIKSAVKSGFHRWIKCNQISKQGYKEVLGEENRKKHSTYTQ
jgi:hypothetical protein